MVVEASLVVAKHENVYAFPKEYVRKDEKGEWLEIETAEGKSERLALDGSIQTEDYILIPGKTRDGKLLTAVYYPAVKEDPEKSPSVAAKPN